MKIQITESDIKQMVLEGVMGVLESIYQGLDDVEPIDELTNAAIMNGFTLIGYHNTLNPNLNKEGFTCRQSGIHFGSLTAAEERAESRGEGFDEYQNWTHKYFLKAVNPLVIETDMQWEFSGMNMSRLQASPTIDIYSYLYNVLKLKVGENGRLYPLSDILNQNGYDAIIYKNGAEDIGNYSIAMFNPNRIKLAEMTTDDQGSPIPVTERFNEQTNDVRY